MDLHGQLRGQSAVKVERPPTLWEADTETEPFLALLGQLIALGLGRGNELADLTLNVADEHRSPAIAFYEATGWRHTHTTDADWTSPDGRPVRLRHYMLTSRT